MMGVRLSRGIRSGRLALLMALILLVAWPSAPAPALGASAVTIDSPEPNLTFGPTVVRISGTYTNAYDLRLYIAGTTQVAALTEDEDGDGSGTWHYDLDLSAYVGEIEVRARALDADTRYGVWSEPLILQVNNPAAAAPIVHIVSPAEGVSLSGTVDIQVAVQSQTAVQSVEVRINSGAWQQASFDGTYYTLAWDTASLGNRTLSLEARVTCAGGKQALSPTTYAKVGTGTSEPFHMASHDRAMWIWEPEAYKLLLNPGSRDVLDAFAQDTATFASDPITTLYMSVGAFAGMDMLEDDPDAVRAFLEWAHQRGYQVYALVAGGTSPPYMGAYEKYHHYAVREIERVINFNLASGSGGKFDGINVDIEPYISPDFKDADRWLQRQYLDLLQKMIGRRDAAGINLPFGPAIPKWYDTSETAQSIVWNGQSKWLSEHIQDISDYISIMDYRDTADGSAGIIAGAQGEIAYATTIGKPGSVVIGVETLDIANSGDPETITFWEEGRVHMEAELAKVYAAYGGSSAFGGIAVHHYDSVRMLPSHWGVGSYAWQPPADTQPPTAVGSGPVAQADGYQAVKLSYGMAFDNTEIDRYIIYRSTVDGFTPDASHIAGLARGLSFNDVGLLPNTTYYYRVAARDLQGNIGPLSPQASVTTGAAALQPAILDGLRVDAVGNRAVAALRAIDMQTGLPLAGAKVEGRFTHAGGKYVSALTDAQGWATFTSEAIPAGAQAGFEPRVLRAAGYYWAQAYDRPHQTALTPWSGLQSLSLAGPGGAIPLPFAAGTTRYALSVPGTTAYVWVTLETAAASSVATVNGAAVQSGQPSVPIALQAGANTLRVLVYNREGTVDTYTIEIEREPAFVVTAAEDTYVYQNDPAANYGSAPVLELADIPNAAGGGDRIAYMKFDFSAHNGPLGQAVLSFYVAEQPMSAVPVKVYGYDADSWSEGTMNWNNRLTSGAIPLGTVHVSEAGWYQLDVTSFVSAQTDNMATFRLMDESTKGVVIRINSKENASNPPYLAISQP